MKQYIPILKHTQLFRGVTEEELFAMLDCLGARLRTYQQGEYVLRQGETLDEITVLVKGKLHIQSDDFWGNSNIITTIDVGEMFGEAYITPDSGTILNNVISVENSAVMFFSIHRIISVCPSACKFHSRVVQNLFFSVSEKNKKLVQKLGYMSKRTTREKLIAYLSDESRRQGSSHFSIPPQHGTSIRTTVTL